MQTIPHTHQVPLATGAQQDTKLKQAHMAAQELETAFLFEMLKSAGLGKTRQAFSGGAGEDHFASILLQHQATEIVKAGGIGMSESILNAIARKEDQS